MFGLGMSEIIFLAVLALIVIGPKELPELARTIGRFLNELKRSTNVLGDELKQQVRMDPYPDHKEHTHNEPESSVKAEEAEQMELVEQEPFENKKEEHKPS
jgi:sec-independent protein translocase protein TatB